MDLVIAHPFLHQMGGGERVVLEIAKKFNPVIYTAIYEPEKTFPEFKEFDIRVLPKSPLELPFAFLKNDPRRSNAVGAGFRYYFAKLKEDYDAINAHGSPSEWIRNRNQRVCWYVHSPNREAFDLYAWRMARLPLWKRPINYALIQAYKAAEFGILPKIEKICTNSEVTNDRIKKYLKRNDAEVIHPGIDPGEFRCDSYDKFFLYPSRIIPEKRFEMAIDAFREFSKKHKGWKLVIAGFLHDSKSEQDYIARLRGLSVGLDVEFVANPARSQLISLYASCYATLFCAINEDWGLVPLESGASSKACISVDEGGPRYSIVNKETGYLVNSAGEMAARMAELAGDPGLNEKIGSAARERMTRKYTWKIFLDGMAKAFKEAAGRKAAFRQSESL